MKKPDVLTEEYVSPLESITAQDLHDNFELISKLFGLKSTVKSILELQN
jgi:type IV secretory pathway component VirB8